MQYFPEGVHFGKLGQRNKVFTGPPTSQPIVLNRGQISNREGERSFVNEIFTHFGSESPAKSCIFRCCGLQPRAASLTPCRCSPPMCLEFGFDSLAQCSWKKNGPTGDLVTSGTLLQIGLWGCLCFWKGGIGGIGFCTLNVHNTRIWLTKHISHISMYMSLSLSIYIYTVHIYFILIYKPPKANWQLKSSTRSCKGSSIQFIEPQPRRDCQWRRGRRPPVTVGSGSLKFGKEIGPHPTGEPSLEGFRIPFFSQPFEVTLSCRQELHSTTSWARNNKIPLLQTGWLWIFSDDVFSFSFTHLALWNGLLVQKLQPLSFLAWRVQGIFDALGQLLHTAIQHEKFFGVANSGALKKQVQVLRVP